MNLYKIWFPHDWVKNLGTWILIIIVIFNIILIEFFCYGMLKIETDLDKRTLVVDPTGENQMFIYWNGSRSHWLKRWRSYGAGLDITDWSEDGSKYGPYIRVHRK